MSSLLGTATAELYTVQDAATMPSTEEVRDLYKSLALDASELVMKSGDSAPPPVLPNAALEIHALERVVLVVLDHDIATEGPLHRLATLAREDRDESPPC